MPNVLNGDDCLTSILVTKKRTPLGGVVLPKETTKEATAYMLDYILIMTDPVTWEFEGGIYSLAASGVCLHNVWETPKGLKEPEKLCGPTRGSVILTLSVLMV